MQETQNQLNFWTYNNRKFVIFNSGLLIFGIILVLINFYIIDSYVANYAFMNGLRNIFNILFNNMVAYVDLQTPEAFSILNNIAIFNLLLNNLIMASSPPSIFPFLQSFFPNTGIIDLIFGLSIVIFSAINLILLKFEIRKLFPKIIDLQFLNIFNSLVISTLIIGISFGNNFVIGFCTLYFALIIFFLINLSPKDNL